MSPGLLIPNAIEIVVQEFNHAKTPFTVLDVQQTLSKARKSLQNPTNSENYGAWAEVLAFTLINNRTMASPWDTFFAPMASGTDEQGKTFYSPDITNADEKVIDHWADRARTIEHPVLKARYADLAWDMCAVIAKRRRDPEMARLAIDSYIASLSLNILPDIHDRYEASLRALDLACLIRDPERIKLAREGLMELFQEGIHAKKGLWWWAFDRLIRNDNTGLTDKEKNELIEGLEMLIQNYGDIASPEKFDPHLLEGAAERLIRYYSRLHRGDDVRRLYAAIARAFEHFAGLGNAMLASAVLQTAVNAYRNAGLREDSERVRILMQEKIGQSHDHMVPIETKMEISREDMEKFLKAIVVDDLWSTFAKIAFEFLPARYSLEEQLRETSKNTPLTALMPLSIVADNHVAAKIGSIEDDPFGRLINYTETNLNLSVFWLHHIFNATMEKHVPAPEHFVAWANRLGLFEDVTFLLEGIKAWFEGDLVKTVYVLVPQVELGLRSIVDQLGKPITKAHSKIADVGVAIGMGDILYDQDLTQALGPDLTLHFLTLYADPRGFNLRNRIAHGLIKPNVINENIVYLLIHTLLIFGVWKELAEKRR